MALTWNIHIFGLKDESDAGSICSGDLIYFVVYLDQLFFCEWILTTSHVTKSDVTQANEDGCPAHHCQLNNGCVVCSEISDHLVNIIFCCDCTVCTVQLSSNMLHVFDSFDWWWDTCGLFTCSINYVLLHVCCWVKRNVHAICCSLITI